MIAHRLIYTDGSCNPNPGFGGWGAAVLSGDGQHLLYTLYGGALDVSNNQMELLAVIEAVRSLTPGTKATILSDSAYVVNGYGNLQKWGSNGWKTTTGTLVKNQHYWAELYALGISHQVSLEWVKGHNGDLYNEMADGLALKGRLAMEAGEASPASPEDALPFIPGTSPLVMDVDFAKGSNEDQVLGVDYGAPEGDETKFYSSVAFKTEVIKTLMKQPPPFSWQDIKT